MNTTRWNLCGVASLIIVPATVPAMGQCLPADPPEIVTVTGVVRDFHDKDHPNGHPDFENQPQGGFGRWSRTVEGELSGKFKDPVLTPSEIFKISTQWHDGFGRTICPCIPDVPMPNALNYPADDPGGFASSPHDGGITSMDSFQQWFSDVPGINMSKLLHLDMVLMEENGVLKYVFDDELDPQYSALGGFFPINDQLLGNDGRPNNFHFTFELHTQFKYCGPGVFQYFKFVGDGDLYVFINKVAVADIGGVHATHDHYVDFTRPQLVTQHLKLLQIGGLYSLDLYYAERFMPQAHFRMETNVILNTVGVPSVSDSKD